MKCIRIQPPIRSQNKVTGLFFDIFDIFDVLQKHQYFPICRNKFHYR
jgi:hypothetical protein